MTQDNNAGTFIIDTQAPIVSSVNITPEITNVRTDLQVEILFWYPYLDYSTSLT